MDKKNPFCSSLNPLNYTTIMQSSLSTSSKDYYSTETFVLASTSDVLFYGSWQAISG